MAKEMAAGRWRGQVKLEGAAAETIEETLAATYHSDLTAGCRRHRGSGHRWPRTWQQAGGRAKHGQKAQQSSSSSSSSKHVGYISLDRCVQAPPWVRAQMAKDMAAGRWRGQAKPEGGAAEAGKDGKKPVPKPYMSTELREDTMRTTGAASCLVEQLLSSLPDLPVLPAACAAVAEAADGSRSQTCLLSDCLPARAASSCIFVHYKHEKPCCHRSQELQLAPLQGGASCTFTLTAVLVEATSDRRRSDKLRMRRGCVAVLHVVSSATGDEE